MIKEAYCSYEVAKLLKEKGFDEKISTYYLVHSNDFPEFFHKKDEFPDPKDVWLKCPTHQMTIAWLREVHNIDICVFPCQTGYILYSYTVKIYKDKEIYLTITDFKTYEEAVEMAIKYSLKNLI